ncbi:hypothetical protein [Paenibacillus fonticola]|uniref:hypothetical protein n=1 Tax=Paenibacillus fonticola TaxID=379896 RepID=UPI00036D3BA6|nr:hypothetical protein [Paenibacillus fonticola]
MVGVGVGVGTGTGTDAGAGAGALAWGPMAPVESAVRAARTVYELRGMQGNRIVKS